MNTSLEVRIAGKPSTRFWLELFGNSAQFSIANILFELFHEGVEVMIHPDVYALVGASVAQAYFLSKPSFGSPLHRLVGNLIGPLIYTLVEVLVEGSSFFSSPNHIAYWVFALLIGLCQAYRALGHGLFGEIVLVLENMIRTSILFFMYALFEIYANSQQTTSLQTFFDDRSHRFIATAVLLLGLGLGLANLTSERYLDLLRQTSVQLRTFSEWLLGRHLLARVIADPTALKLMRTQRVVLFMDIRKFTAWSEAQSPEAVVSLLSQYYQVAEAVLNQFPIIKSKLSADEVLVVFSSADDALAAAAKLREQICGLLAPMQLGVGIGVHAGPVVEGLLGSGDVKFYDVIGDTVNTAKRIESQARAGEVLISQTVHDLALAPLQPGAAQEISVKGKTEPLTVYAI
ncbi:MAG: adenylate/guanylate cyclase domain-containing protein [Chloroflexi bacterium]|nr:adenylate/guanylate cyclase domain-containing protein [Chloroflexota bacterium]